VHPVARETLRSMDQHDTAYIDARLTESEHSLVGDNLRAADHVPRVTFGHFVVAYVEAEHIFGGQRLEERGDLRSACSAFKFDGHEDVCTVRGAVTVVSVNELGHGTRVNGRVQRDETGGVVYTI
jgi:hypothetical protein